MSWKEFLQKRRGAWSLVFCFVVLSLMVTVLPTYYNEVIQPRPGIVLNDAFLNSIEPRDWSTPVFVILVAAILQSILMHLKDPLLLITGLTTYCMINVIRTYTMYAYPLEPPDGMILLIDPISATFVYPQQTFAKDLFFSGHVSTMVVLIFVESNWLLRWLKLMATTLMAIFLAWQHVHYTVDLVVAPVVTYGVYRAVVWYFRDLQKLQNPSL